MTYLNRNIESFQGENLVITIPIYDKYGAPYGDTSGISFTWNVSESPDSAILLTKSSGAGIVNGISVITITIDAVDTDVWGAFTYYHEGRGTDLFGIESVAFDGGWNIMKSNTRSVASGAGMWPIGLGHVYTDGYWFSGYPILSIWLEVPPQAVLYQQVFG